MGFCLVILLYSVSCKKDSTNATPAPNPTPSSQKYSLSINITHFFGDSLFKYNTKFINAANDTIKFNKLAYYFSNLKLTKDDGSVYAPETYFLINFDNSSTAIFQIDNIPQGTYNKFSFFVGVDSLHNHSLAQTGALDPGYGMFWSWNVGYIFNRLKGNFGAANTALTLDVGGDANLMKYDLPTSIVLTSNKVVNLKMDIKEYFQNPYAYSLKTDDSSIHDLSAPGISKLVQNSKDMFSVTSVQ